MTRANEAPRGAKPKEPPKPTEKEGTNDALTALRLVIMACFVERKMTAVKLRFLHGLATQLGLTPGHVAHVVAVYEDEALRRQKQEKTFFFRNGALPKSLVHENLDRITHLDLRLHVAYNMMLVLTQEPGHTAREVTFVEACVGYWKIRKAWRELLESSKSPNVRHRRPRGAVGA